VTTLDELRNLLHSDFELDPVTLHAETTFADIGLDSLAMAEFMFLLEERFQVEFAEDQQFVATVGELVATIDRLREPGLARAA
jgi:acyl carrier protein